MRQTDCTWSEAHRQACEVRSLCAMEKAARQDYYADVIRTRGRTAARALVDAVNLAWKG